MSQSESLLTLPPLQGSDVPAIQRHGLGYRGRWFAQDIVLELSHMRSERGDPSGLLTVWCSGAVLMSALRLTLTAPATRGKLAKDLSALTAGYDGWGEILDRFCRHVVRLEFDGADAAWLEPVNEQLAEAFLVDPIVPRDQVTLWYGPGDSCKSTLTVGLAVAVASGHPLLGWTSLVGPVLVLDWETDRSTWARRLSRMSNGLGVSFPRDTVAYMHCDRPLYRLAEAVAARAAETEAMLVIVDSRMMATGASREGSSPEDGTQRLFDALQLLPGSKILVDHVTGENQDNSRIGARNYGSVLAWNLSRAVWEVRAEQRHTQLSREVLLSHRKANDSRLQQPIGLRASFSDEQTVLEPCVISAPDLRQHAADPREQIAGCLASNGALSVKEISEEVGMTERQVRRELNDGRFLEVIQGSRGRGGHGSRWGLKQ